MVLPAEQERELRCRSPFDTVSFYGGGAHDKGCSPRREPKISTVFRECRKLTVFSDSAADLSPLLFNASVTSTEAWERGQTPPQVLSEDSAKTDLGRISFFWLNFTTRPFALRVGFHARDTPTRSVSERSEIPPNSRTVPRCSRDMRTVAKRAHAQPRACCRASAPSRGSGRRSLREFRGDLTAVA